MRLRELLNELYPYYYSGRSLVQIALIVFVFTTSFYYLTQPFEINKDEHRLPFFWISVIHAMVPVFILIVQAQMVALFLRKENPWKLKSEMVFFGFFLLLVGIGQFLIRDLIYVNSENFSVKYLWEEIRNTYIIGGVFLLIIVPWNFNRLKIKNMRMASNLAPGPFDATHKKSIRIHTKVKSESFDLHPDHFLFVRSEGNYLHFHLVQTETPAVLMKRMSIRELIDQVSNKMNVVQTHRSYLVHLPHVVEVKGNAAGYSLTFCKSDEKALVSRNRIPVFETELKSNRKSKL